jgi:putative DNA primase/helicase
MNIKEQIDTAKNSSVQKTNGPYEVNDNVTSSSANPTSNTTINTDNPTKEETLGQNQVADIVSDALRDSMAWDSSSGQWFKRPDINKPFSEHDSDSSWLAISMQIGQIKPKYTSSFVSGVEKFVRAQLSVTHWDTHRQLLPVSNGVLDLKTKTLRKYQPSDRFNWQLPYPYQSTATCPLIDKTLARMVGNDPALMRFLYAWLLVVLLGRYDVQAFLELVGDGGTGKSTFLRLLAFLVGDENVRSTDLHSLECNQFETAALYGKRLTIITDSARFRGEVPVLKSITGGDPVRLERKHQQQRKPFIYSGLVAIAANQPLESSDYSSGLKRRRRSLSINYKLSDTDKLPYRDKEKYPDGFEGALRLEMSGLLNCLLALEVTEAVNLIASPDDAMQAQCLAIELETNPLLAWADERLVRCTSNETQIGDKTHGPDQALFSNYCSYVEASGQRPVSMTRFSRALVDILVAHGVSTHKKRGGFTYLSGLRLRKAYDGDIGALVSSSQGGDVGLKPQDGVGAEFVEYEGCKQTTDFSHNECKEQTSHPKIQSTGISGGLDECY